MPLEQLGGAQNGLQRVVQLVRDARHQNADSRQALLPDDLPLQRLQRLAYSAPARSCRSSAAMRVAQAARPSS